MTVRRLGDSKRTMKFIDRILTIVITATLTSAVWIVFGSTMMEIATEPSEAVDGSTPETGKSDTDGTASVSEAPTAEAPAAQATNAPVAVAIRTELAMPVSGVSAADLKDSFLDPRDEAGLRRHEAIDIMAPKGTPVTAAAPGRIAKIHNSKAGGKSVYVRSRDKTKLYFYAHLDSYADGLKEGESVKVGDALGTVGNTGNAKPDAPHLHFAVLQTTKDAEWWEPANAINPYPLLTEPVE